MKKKQISFNLCKKPEVSSVFKPNNEFLERFPEAERFEIVDINSSESSTLDIELGNIQIDFVKLDIQGSELFALMGMQNQLSSCLGLEIEVEFSSLYKKQPLFGEEAMSYPFTAHTPRLQKQQNKKKRKLKKNKCLFE